MSDEPQQLTGYRLRDYDDLIARLGESRRTQGMSQHALARAAHVGHQQLGKWLTGRTWPLAPNLVAVVEALGYDLALIPRQRPDEVPLDIEHVSAATIASVMAIVDAPYRPGLDVELEPDEDAPRAPLSEPQSQDHSVSVVPEANGDPDGCEGVCRNCRQPRRDDGSCPCTLPPGVDPPRIGNLGTPNPGSGIYE